MRVKRPTRTQKMVIVKCGYNPEDYNVVKENADNLRIRHKKTGEIVDLRF